MLESRSQAILQGSLEGIIITPEAWFFTAVGTNPRAHAFTWPVHAVVSWNRILHVTAWAALDRALQLSLLGRSVVGKQPFLISGVFILVDNHADRHL